MEIDDYEEFSEIVGTELTELNKFVDLRDSETSITTIRKWMLPKYAVLMNIRRKDDPDTEIYYTREYWRRILGRGSRRT